MMKDKEGSSGRKNLRRAVIVFAVVEALVIVAVLFYKFLR